METKKIGIISQNGTDAAFVISAYHILGNLLKFCDTSGKYQAFLARNASNFVTPLVQKGIEKAVSDGNRYTKNRYYQINAEPIIDGMLNYSSVYPDTEFIMIMRDSIYAQNLNYFLGVNRKSTSFTGELLNSTIISTGKNSPFEIDIPTFQSIFMHELGHRFGATNNQNRKDGELYDNLTLGTHCTTPGCIMNVINSLHDGQLATQRNAMYCPSCLAAIKKEFSH